jgi:hypothetical protein
MVGLAYAGFCATMKLALANSARQVETPTIDKGTAEVTIETMRSCVMQASAPGVTSAGLDQAHRLCWNRAELVGKKHKEK